MLKYDIVISRSNFIRVIFLFLYLFTVYYTLMILAHFFIGPNYQLIVIPALNFDVALSILLSSFIIKKNNKRITYLTPVAITIMSLFLFVASEAVEISILFAIAALLGIGLIGFFNFFQEVTTRMERSRVAGITAFITLPLILLLQVFGASANANIFFLLLIVFSLVICMLLFFKRKPINNFDSSATFFEKRVVILYAIPWIVFSIINVTLAKVTSAYIQAQVSPSLLLLLLFFQLIGVCVGVITCGFLTDFIGRRISLALTLTLYGASSALGGIFISKEVYSLMYFINGFSWGILFVLYIFVIWSDLTKKENGAKMYALGATIYFMSLGVGAIIPQLVLQNSTSSLLACLIIFMTILPVFMCPELANTDFIDKRRVKRYLDTVRKIKRNQG